MHKLQNGNWQENRIPRERRPTALPIDCGAHWLGHDLASRWNCRSFIEETEPLYALGITAYQQMLVDGPPWSCFRTNQFNPYPTYESEAPAGTEPEWHRFHVETFADFLAHYDGGMSPDRIAQLLRKVDLLADYLFAAKAIDDATRRRWVEDAKRVLDGLIVSEAA